MNVINRLFTLFYLKISTGLARDRPEKNPWRSLSGQPGALLGGTLGGRSLMDNIEVTWESVKCKRISVSKKARSEIVPDGVDSLRAEDVSENESRIRDDWVWYMEDLKSKKFALVNHNEKVVKVLCALWSSRYHEKGQAKQKRRIKKAWGHYFFKHGVMLTLTFAPKKILRIGAWCDLGYKVRAFIDRVNKWRESRGISKIKGFLHINEDQAGTNYPAPHIVFPGLKYLAPHDVLAKLWGYGFVKVNVGGSIHPANYACKYITKMNGKEFMMGMMWFFNIRTYTFSRVFRYKREDWVNPGWEFLKRGGRKDGQGLEDLEDTVSKLREDEGYIVLNQELLKLWSRCYHYGWG
jgi:hypothetical protein